MRKSLAALVFVAVSASLVPGPAAVAATSAEQQDILKRKKRQAVLKKSLKAEEEAIKKAEARLKAAQKAKAQRAVIIKPAAKGRSDQVLAGNAQTRRQCGTFLKCLFGSRRTPDARVQTASLAGTGLSGRSLRETVDWAETRYKPGSLIVRTPERALYYVLPGGEAIRYSVGVGREGFQWSGKSKIVAKQEWPTWRPPSEMIKREAEKGHILPEEMEGGPGNPLGARALYIGGTIFRVHGTNNEASIGGAVSSGCIRMMNADVVDLYSRVKIGAPIFVYQ
jgi:lipoprotein-anchoring transpeptidase ErfK/SrfK